MENTPTEAMQGASGASSEAGPTTNATGEMAGQPANQIKTPRARSRSGGASSRAGVTKRPAGSASRRQTQTRSRGITRGAASAAGVTTAALQDQMYGALAGYAACNWNHSLTPAENRQIIGNKFGQFLNGFNLPQI